MAIQWFPGHMNKARKKIAEAMPAIDLVIEVLDARLPFSSTNPLVDELRGDTPCIKLLNKADLADEKITRQWVAYFEQQHQVRAMPLVAEQKPQVKQVVQLCKQLGQQRLERKRPVRIMIMGIPNVGKSTLINALAGRQVAKTGNEPAVTKANQMIDLKNGLVLSDTPGILWPKFEPESCGYRLAASGAVKDTAIEYQDVALFALDYLLHNYPQALQQRFKLKALPASAEQALDDISRKRGGLKPGGVADTHKGAEVSLHELRAGKIGRLSLETPAQVEQELAALAELQASSAAESPDTPE